MIQKLKNYEDVALESTGESGGISTIWDKRKWELMTQKTSRHWIRIELRNLITKEQYRIINVYSPNHYREKEQCWKLVKEEIAEKESGNLILGGDLNLIRNTEEKFGGIFHNDLSREALEGIIEEQKLIDIPPSNGKYTQNNKRIGKNNIKESLDKILIHESIATAYTLVKSKIVHNSASDHKPVVLTFGKLEN